MKTEIDALQTWAKTRARMANTPEDEPAGSVRFVLYQLQRN
jgi:hypothetical protein